MAKIDKFKEFKFKKTETAKRDQLYIYLMYEGGDADTRHPEEYPLNIKFSEYKEHLPEIYEIIDKYQRLKVVLDCGSYGGRIDWDNKTKKFFIKDRMRKSDIPIDDDLQDMIDNVPNDPQNDFQDKCYLATIKLIGYDENGDKHESYV